MRRCGVTSWVNCSALNIIQPEHAQSAIQRGCAGRGQQLLRYLVKMRVALHHQYRRLQSGQMFRRHVRAASHGFGNFLRHVLLSIGHLFENLPAQGMAQCCREFVQVGRYRRRPGF